MFCFDFYFDWLAYRFEKDNHLMDLAHTTYFFFLSINCQFFEARQVLSLPMNPFAICRLYNVTEINCLKSVSKKNKQSAHVQ